MSPLLQKNHTIYRIEGNVGEVFNLANWQFYGKSPNLKNAIIFYSDNTMGYVHIRIPIMHICMPTLPGICHAAKFKTHQFVLGNDLLDSILAKVSHYTVLLS